MATTTTDHDRARSTVEPSAVAYRTFSPRLAPALLTAGGVLAIVGGLGVWVRAVEISTTKSVVHAGSVSGAGRAWGWIIAGLGVLIAAGALAWAARAVVRIGTPALGVIAAVFMALRIAGASRDASAMAFKAGARAGTAFTAYHAGFGWGAWVMTISAVLLTLGSVVALLRLLDIRRGYEG